MRKPNREISGRTRLEMQRGAARSFEVGLEERRDQRAGNKRWAKWRDRMAYMTRVTGSGDVRCISELGANGLPVLKPVCVTVAVGECYFSDPVKSYPTQKLVANVALAISAGMSGRPDLSTGDFNYADY